MACNGNKEDHCCYLNGKVCQYLKENSNGRRWSCGLYEKYGSWNGVYESDEYKEDIVSELVKISIVFDRPYFNCGEWPTKGEVCTICGEVGK